MRYCRIKRGRCSRGLREVYGAVISPRLIESSDS